MKSKRCPIITDPSFVYVISFQYLRPCCFTIFHDLVRHDVFAPQYSFVIRVKFHLFEVGDPVVVPFDLHVLLWTHLIFSQETEDKFKLMNMLCSMMAAAGKYICTF